MVLVNYTLWNIATADRISMPVERCWMCQQMKSDVTVTPRVIDSVATVMKTMKDNWQSSWGMQDTPDESAHAERQPVRVTDKKSFKKSATKCSTSNSTEAVNIVSGVDSRRPNTHISLTLDLQLTVILKL